MSPLVASHLGHADDVPRTASQGSNGIVGSLHNVDDRGKSHVLLQIFNQLADHVGIDVGKAQITVQNIFVAPRSTEGVGFVVGATAMLLLLGTQKGQLGELGTGEGSMGRVMVFSSLLHSGENALYRVGKLAVGVVVVLRSIAGTATSGRFAVVVIHLHGIAVHGGDEMRSV